MKKARPNRKLRNFRLSNYTIAELTRLSELHQTNMTAIVELAVAHLSHRGESDGKL